ncbi:allophanate hydrolase [Magnetospirillum sulfuroxidans]|uniref:Allophanate hydrolase n=1 Tax=Magnetospirillum sulfuroxidans TaxID=611300 RepID=A0ABS5IAW3_9PROT|nr:allophanate hydrolase [Magnetospirillum sulfuroxidans]MBR9971449.1 allophanate hydrolase [Magnetospirillum sulfuroxidans]
MQSLDIASLSAGYGAGTLTPAHVLDTVYARIDQQGERPVWITLVAKADALAQLAAAPKGKLWGIPFAVKDNIDVAGLPTTAGCPDFAYVPSRSAHVVEALQAEGAILIGKTNLDQFATGLVGTRSPYGICSSVFSADHISGGSSAGSAVAVAAGLVSFSLGTDTAGSGRVPAAFNNIVGLKPSKGLLSNRGLVPACRSLDCISIFATTCADALAVLAVTGRPDPEDAFSRSAPQATQTAAWPDGFRFGVPAGRLEFFGDDQAESLFHRAVERLRAIGGMPVEIDFTPFSQCAQLLYSGPWVAERLAAIEDFATARPDCLHEVVRGIILSAKGLSAVDSFKGLYRLAELIRQAEAQWAKMEVLLLPTTGTTYRIDEVLADPVKLNSNLGVYTNFVNLMDLSAIALPAGFRPNGLPFGVTLLGRAFADGKIAALADRLHRALPTATLAATPIPLATTPPIPVDAAAAGTITVAVVGAHLSGQPLHHQLSDRDARLRATCRTAPGYSLYALAKTQPAKPGLVFDGHGAGAIEVEIYEMDAAAFGSFVALIPPPLGIGTVTLADGATVKGFLCESHAIEGATDITRHGGWRAWLASP